MSLWGHAGCSWDGLQLQQGRPLLLWLQQMHLLRLHLLLLLLE